jgi:DNA-directed RNA polymerase subunit H (RpoH/RPB5)
MDRISEIKANQLALLQARGYSLSEDEESFLRGEDVQLDQDEIYQKADGTTDVRFLIGVKVGKPEIAGLLAPIWEHRIESTFTLLWIGPNITSPAKKKIEDARRRIAGNIEIWSVAEILVNPLKHYLVPPHRILTPEEIAKEIPAIQDDQKKAKAFLASMKAFVNDPVPRWLGAKVGDIIRTDRWSDLLQGTIPDYRIVKKIIL